MKKRMKKIIRGVVKYRQGLLPVLSKNVGQSEFLIRFERYEFGFQWLEGKPFGEFYVLTRDKIKVYEATYESEYQKYDYVDKTQVRVLFSGNTDNATYIRKIIEETLFPSIE